jgi:hypothetical protein
MNVDAMLTPHTRACPNVYKQPLKTRQSGRRGAR